MKSVALSYMTESKMVDNKRRLPIVGTAVSFNLMNLKWKHKFAIVVSVILGTIFTHDVLINFNESMKSIFYCIIIDLFSHL